MKTKKSNDIGLQMYLWAKDLFPINRSITGEGLRLTLYYIKNILPTLKIYNVPSGTKAFDWQVPEEWNVKDAFIKDSKGKIIVDFKKNNLHLVGYSCPIDRWVELSELNKHLHSIENLPNAIPYITSYYNRNWGFCLTHNQRKKLKDQKYHVLIKSKFSSGNLNYGEIILPGKTKKEIFISTYICHPSMANNELSGPILATALAQWLKSQEKTHYTYRIIFIPETIGSVVYINKNLAKLKKNVIAGFNLTCVGDNRMYSYMPSRKGNTISDKVAKYVLSKYIKKFKEYTFLERGSDERQYCSPGVDLPIVSIMRSKYHEYPEYHTSLDNLSLINPDGLRGSFEIHRKIMTILELNKIYKNNYLCEPQLSKKNLYPKISSLKTKTLTKEIMNVLAYIDGEIDLLDIAIKTKIDFFVCAEIVNKLLANKIIKEISKS
jgi:aminopeptidase-like protein